MAIQVRRGNEADFDASKMLPGEWAVSLDAKYVRMCFAPGLVLRMATYESFEADRAQIQAILAECKDIQTAIKRIQGEVNSNAALTVESANSAKESADRAHGEAERALSEADRAHSEAERAKSYMDGAESVIGVKLADLYQTKAGAIIEKASGESPLCIRDTVDNLVRNLKLYGNTEQDAYSGNQLFDANALKLNTNTSLDIYDDGYTIVAKGGAAGGYTDSVYFLELDNLLGRTVYLMADSITGGEAVHLVVTNANGTITFNAINEQTLSKTVIIPADATRIQFRILTNNTNTALGTDNTLTIKGLRLCFDANAKWEPYTGGQASLNPDYPQEIKSVVVNEVKAHGKNLVKTKTINPALGHYNSALFVEAELKPKTTYTLSFKGTVGNNYYFNENLRSAWAGCIVVDGINSITFTTPDIVSKSDRNQYIEELGGWVFLKNNSANNSAHVFEEVMLRYADIEDDTYEPYTENSITLSQPIELNNIGVRGNADILTPDSFTPSFRRVVVTGDENWTAHDSIVGLWYVSILPYAIAYSYEIKSDMLCTRYTTYTRRVVCEGTIGIANQGAEVFIYDDTVSTADELKAKYKAWHDAGEPMEIVYRLRDEGIIFEPLPTADQIALRSLLSYDGVTYLECDSEVVPTIEAECVLDTKRYIDRKFAELATALV